MEVELKKGKKGYALKKILNTAILRKGRVLADLSQNVEFMEDKENEYRVHFR